MKPQPISAQVVYLPGLTLDTLGLYFAALGLLRLLSRKWPQVRGCWRDGGFAVTMGPESLEQITSCILEVGTTQTWDDYGKPWDEHQKKDTKLSQAKKPIQNVALWQSFDASEDSAVLQQSHLATGDRLSFNPLFGTGGNAGKRLFSEGWKKAKNAVINPPRGVGLDIVHNDLSAFLTGGVCCYLSDFAAGSWFSSANKVYNSGLRKPFSEGQLTPWAMLLACEAFPFLAGAPSRQLGASRRATGAFPFVTRGPAPGNESEAGQNLGEFWAPVWNRPMSLTEIAALFQTGRAEIGGKAALTSAAFAGAIIQRGVDSGIQEFRSFSLIRTTSENTFESRLSAAIPVAQSQPTFIEAIRRALAIRESLPPDSKQGTRWRYRGLQGPIDRALIDLAEVACSGREEAAAEYSWALLDALFASLSKVDRNKTFREAGVRFELLPLPWLASLLGKSNTQQTEIRLAISLASIRAEMPVATEARAALKAPQPFLAYRLGCTRNGRYWTIPKDIPLRCIWSPCPIADNIIALAKRRTIESHPTASPPFRSGVRASISDALAFVAGNTDDEALARWIDRFSLFDWSASEKEFNTLQKEFNTLRLPAPSDNAGAGDSTALLYGYFRPLFDQFLLLRLEPDSGPRTTAGRLAPILSALERDDVQTAWLAANSSYRAERVALADFPAGNFEVVNPRRLLASLIFPVRFTTSLEHLFARWRSPAQPKQTL